MRFLFAVMMSLCFVANDSKAQENTDIAEREPLRPRILALDNSIIAAKKFNEELASAAVDYKLSFVDEESRPLIRYIYKTDNGETMRMDFKYTIEGDTERNIAKRPVVIFQRISAELIIITYMYNYLFNTNYSPDRIMAEATVGADLVYRGKKYLFVLQPDDYNPGYWVMTMMRG